MADRLNVGIHLVFRPWAFSSADGSRSTSFSGLDSSIVSGDSCSISVGVDGMSEASFFVRFQEVLIYFLLPFSLPPLVFLLLT